MPLVDHLGPLRRLTRGVEVAQITHLGGSVVSVLYRTPVLVLETTGRRTGRRRRTPLAHHLLPEDGSSDPGAGARRWLVVGGANGQRRVPDWVANLRAEPGAVVVVRRQRVAVTSRELRGAELDATWPALVDVWPRIAVYRRRAGRPVPVFELRG